MKSKMKSFLEPLRLLRKNLWSLVGFELICRGLCILVFFPIFNWMQRLFLITNKTTVITAQNAKSFILNPFTWLIIIAIALVMTVFAMFERLAIVDTLHAAKCGVKLSVRQIFHNGFDLTVQRFRLRNWSFIPYTIFILHFGMIVDVSNVTSFIRIPGFILEDFEKRPWEKVVFCIGIILLVYFFLRWAFSIPFMAEEKERDFAKARKKSWSMTKGIYIFKILLFSIIWSILASLILILTSLLIVVIWYLGSLWLIPGNTPTFQTFILERFTPTIFLLFIAFSWVIGPLILAVYQDLYYVRKRQLDEPVRDYTQGKDYIGSYPVVRLAAILGLIVCIFFSGPKVFAKAKWMMNTKLGVPLIMAHRGYSYGAPENTLPAFEKAIEIGCTAAELDVQMTKDGEIVVLHDSNLKRTTGVDKNIWEVNYDEIRNLDAGSHFSEEYAGTPIPTLAQVLSECNDDLYFNIEIKRTGHDDGITEKTIDTILKYGDINRCDITSQDYETIEEVRAINPSILTAYTSVIGIGNVQDLDAADILSIQETFATYDNIQNLHNAGKKVFVWTVNEEGTMEDLITLNVDAILTNDPVLCKEVVDDFSALNTIRRLQQVFTTL